MGGSRRQRRLERRLPFQAWPLPRIEIREVCRAPTFSHPFTAHLDGARKVPSPGHVGTLMEAANLEASQVKTSLEKSLEPQALTGVLSTATQTRLRPANNPLPCYRSPPRPLGGQWRACTGSPGQRLLGSCRCPGSRARSSPHTQQRGEPCPVGAP